MLQPTDKKELEPCWPGRENPGSLPLTHILGLVDCLPLSHVCSWQCWGSHMVPRIQGLATCKANSIILCSLWYCRGICLFSGHSGTAKHLLLAMCSGITPVSTQEDCGVAGTKPGSAVQGKLPPSVLLALWPCSQTCLQDLAG